MACVMVKREGSKGAYLKPNCAIGNVVHSTTVWVLKKFLIPWIGSSYFCMFVRSAVQTVS